MTEIVMVRHGETVWHAENRYAGSSDVPLTENGRAQALRLARWARTAELSACYSSTLSRAVETVRPAAAAAGVPARHDERLCEVDFGVGEGRTAAEMRAEFGEQHSAFQRDPVADHLPGGEDPREAVARASRALADITARVPDGRVLVVWHSTLMRLVLCRLLGVPLSEYRRVFPAVRNVATTRIRIGDEACSLLEFNSPLEP